MRGLTRRQAVAAGGLFAAGLTTRPLSAQKLSDRNITIIVPFTPGSGPDILAVSPQRKSAIAGVRRSLSTTSPAPAE